MHLTAHAIERYQERVENVPDDVVRARLTNFRVKAAVAFGATAVRLSSGAKLIIKDKVIVTVLPPAPKRRRKGYRYVE